MKENNRDISIKTDTPREQDNHWLILKTGKGFVILKPKNIDVNRNATRYILSVRIEVTKKCFDPVIILKCRSHKREDCPVNVSIEFGGDNLNGFYASAQSAPIYSILHRDYVSLFRFPIKEKDFFDFIKTKGGLSIIQNGDVTPFSIPIEQDWIELKEEAELIHIKNNLVPEQLTAEQKLFLSKELQRQEEEERKIQERIEKERQELERKERLALIDDAKKVVAFLFERYEAIITADTPIKEDILVDKTVYNVKKLFGFNKKEILSVLELLWKNQLIIDYLQLSWKEYESYEDSFICLKLPVFDHGSLQMLFDVIEGKRTIEEVIDLNGSKIEALHQKRAKEEALKLEEESARARQERLLEAPAEVFVTYLNRQLKRSNQNQVGRSRGYYEVYSEALDKSFEQMEQDERYKALFVLRGENFIPPTQEAIVSFLVKKELISTSLDNLNGRVLYTIPDLTLEQAIGVIGGAISMRDIALQNNKKNKEGCYVATCVYGSYNCPEVWTLRRFRDYALKKSIVGRVFIKCYYATSPTLVKWFGSKKLFCSLNRSILDKWVESLKGKGYSCEPYQD